MSQLLAPDRRRAPAPPADHWRTAAKVSLGALIVVSPLRARLVLVEHRVGTVYTDYTDVLVGWSDVALAAVLVCWAASLARTHRRPARPPGMATASCLVLVAVAVAGLPFAVDRVVSVTGVVHLAAGVALAWAVSDLVDRPRPWLVPVGAMVVVQAGIGLAQVGLQRSVGLRLAGEHVLRPELGVSVITTADGTRVVRAYGLTDHPNILGGLLAVGVLLLAAGLAAMPRGAVIARVAAGIAVALGAAGLAATFSRSAWIAGLVAAACLVGAAWRWALRRSTVLPIGVAALGAVVVLAANTGALYARTGVDRGIATEQRSIDERGSVSRVTADVALDHPILGVGLGGLPVAMAGRDAHATFQVQPAPIVVLDVLAETGVVGVLAYGALMAAPFVFAVRRRHRLGPEVVVALAALVAIDVIGLFDYYTWTYASGRVWAWALLGWWAAAARRADAGAGAMNGVRDA